MKNKILYLIFMLSLLAVSCQKEYIEQGSLTSVGISETWNTAEEVRATTSTLYSGLPWNGFMSRALDDIGDVMSGNAHCYTGNGDYRSFVEFSQSGTTALVGYCWASFYKVAGWSSAYLKAIEVKKSLGGDPTFLDPAIAECRFMIGASYFYIARVFGAAPIVEDPGAVALSGNTNIPRYKKEDVLRYAIENMLLAEQGLPENDPQAGRATKMTAKAFLAKMYLYQKDYTKAAEYAKDVVISGKYDLVSGDDYQKMFNSSSLNNNIESIFAIQYQLTQNPWGAGNQLQCDRGPGNLQTSESSMWELFRPSLDFLNAWEAGDKRRVGTVMEHGWTMPGWKPKTADDSYNAFMANGYVYDTSASCPQAARAGSSTGASIAKYVVGPGSSYGGEGVLGMNTGQNFMILRYSDILLIYAEAILAGGSSTSDANALNAFNKVRTRAGLSTKSSITLDDIMQERRMEFAFEGDYWYDIQRQGFAKAKSIIEAQDRGDKNGALHVTFTEDKMYLPIPASEILQDPELANDPVPYYND